MKAPVEFVLRSPVVERRYVRHREVYRRADGSYFITLTYRLHGRYVMRRQTVTLADGLTFTCTIDTQSETRRRRFTALGQTRRHRHAEVA